jgi:hypothetical protein
MFYSFQKLLLTLYVPITAIMSVMASLVKRGFFLERFLVMLFLYFKNT